MTEQLVNSTHVKTCDKILIGLGANLPSTVGGPEETLQSALLEMTAIGIKLTCISPFYRSQPVPVSDQNWFVNGVAEIQTAISATALMQVLHDLENKFGRRRSVPNAARVLDLDLLAYGRLVTPEADPLQVPHPRLQDRAFVLKPLADIAPTWQHPVSGLTATDMLAALPPGQILEKMPDQAT